MLLLVAILYAPLAHYVAADSFNNFTKPNGGIAIISSISNNVGGLSWALGSTQEIEFHTDRLDWSITLMYVASSDHSSSNPKANILTQDHKITCEVKSAPFCIVVVLDMI